MSLMTLDHVISRNWPNYFKPFSLAKQKSSIWLILFTTACLVSQASPSETKTIMKLSI